MQRVGMELGRDFMEGRAACAPGAAASVVTVAPDHAPPDARADRVEADCTLRPMHPAAAALADGHEPAFRILRLLALACSAVEFGWVVLTEVVLVKLKPGEKARLDLQFRVTKAGPLLPSWSPFTRAYAEVLRRRNLISRSQDDSSKEGGEDGDDVDVDAVAGNHSDDGDAEEKPDGDLDQNNDANDNENGDNDDNMDDDGNDDEFEPQEYIKASMHDPSKGGGCGDASDEAGDGDFFLSNSTPILKSSHDVVMRPSKTSTPTRSGKQCKSSDSEGRATDSPASPPSEQTDVLTRKRAREASPPVRPSPRERIRPVSKPIRGMPPLPAGADRAEARIEACCPEPLPGIHRETAQTCDDAAMLRVRRDFGPARPSTRSSRPAPADRPRRRTSDATADENVVEILDSDDDDDDNDDGNNFTADCKSTNTEEDEDEGNENNVKRRLRITQRERTSNGRSKLSLSVRNSTQRTSQRDLIVSRASGDDSDSSDDDDDSEPT
jgi:hypothetical protein